MKKYFILLLGAVILLSGCVDQRTVKMGDNISIDYTGRLQDGTVFDTSLESVAKANNIFDPRRDYEPLNFTVGKKGIITGLSDGVIGMTVGQSKTLTILPEKAYGQINPEMIQVYPRIQEMPATESFPRIINISLSRFEAEIGTGHKAGDVVAPPGSDFNYTVKNISNEVFLSYNLKVGDILPSTGLPWNITVIKIDDKNVTVKHDVNKNYTFQFQLDTFQKTPWDTTVTDVNSMNITLRHNAIPDTEIQSMFGPVKVHFNETSIIMDSNHELAGKTLIFNATLISINK